MRRPPRRSTGPSEARGYPGREVGGAGPGTPRLRPRAPPTWQTKRHRPPRRQCGRRETLPGRGAAHPGVRVPIGNPWARPTAGLRVRWSSSAHVCRTPLKAPPPCKVVDKQGRGSRPLNVPRGGGRGRAGARAHRPHLLGCASRGTDGPGATQESDTAARPRARGGGRLLYN